MAFLDVVDEHPEADRDGGARCDRSPSGISSRRMLVPFVLPSGANSGFRQRVDSRASAPFLVHLLATATGVPQTRARRRADPTQAVAAYADRMHVLPSVGRAIRESR
jgi:hypothetical protein